MANDPIHARLFMGDVPHFEAVAWGEGYRARKHAQMHGVGKPNPYTGETATQWAMGWSVAGNEIYPMKLVGSAKPERPPRTTRENVNK